MKIYLAGKMSGVPYFNFPAFNGATKALRAKGHEVFSPAEKDVERAGNFQLLCPTGSKEELIAANVPQINYKDCMKIDLNWIIDNADAIALLPDWNRSAGAKVEKALAELLGLEVIFLVEGEDYDAIH